MLKPQLLTVWLVVGCFCYHVAGMEENPTPECGEDQYISPVDQKCYPCRELTCPAGYEPNLSCGSGRSLTGAACTKCQDGYFSETGEHCQQCSVSRCHHTVNDTPCTLERDIICGPCKKGYVMLGNKCISCKQVPYPSLYEACKEQETQSDEMLVAYAVGGSSKPTVEKKEGSDPSVNSMLVIIILAGLILLVGLVIILSIVIICNYKRYGTCRFATGSRPHDDGRDLPVDARPVAIHLNENHVPSDQGYDETDRLTPVGPVGDIQPGLRLSENVSFTQPNGGLVRELQHRTVNDPSYGQQPVNVAQGVTSVDTDDDHDFQTQSETQLTAEGSSSEVGSRQSFDRSFSHSSQSLGLPGRNFNPQGGMSSQLCSGCSSIKQQDVSIGNATTVNIYSCNGRCSSHPSSQADQQDSTKYNPGFNPFK